MIVGTPVILRPTTPGVAPGSALPAGPAGASAYQLAGGDAAWGSLAAWQASLVGPSGPLPDPAAIARAVAAAGFMPNTTGALQALLGTLPTSPAGLAPGALYLDGGVPALAQP